MIKRFMDGLAFGAGFSVAFAIVWIVVWMLLIPVFYPSSSLGTGEPVIIEYDDLPGTSPPSSEDFDEMSVDEQIALSSVIALATYEPDADGRMRAVITEIVKHEAGVESRFDVGDEYHSLSYYPDDDDFKGDGNVIFFAGSPARMRVAMTYRGDRITGLSNIPMKLFRQKCADSE